MSRARATSIATHLNYETWKMDVKTTYLNNNLDESIYDATRWFHTKWLRAYGMQVV